MAINIAVGKEQAAGIPPRLDLSRFAPTNRRRLSAPALRTFIAIADLWGLSEEQRRLILGFPSRSTYHSWCKQAREHEGSDWLHQPHAAPMFGGHPPLDLVTSGTQDGLMTVRRFLDAARGGTYIAPNSADVGFAPYDDSEIVFE